MAHFKTVHQARAPKRAEIPSFSEDLNTGRQYLLLLLLLLQKCFCFYRTPKAFQFSVLKKPSFRQRILTYSGNIEISPYGWPPVQCDQIGRFIALLGIFSKPVAKIAWSTMPTSLGKFCKGVKKLSCF